MADWKKVPVEKIDRTRRPQDNPRLGGITMWDPREIDRNVTYGSTCNREKWRLSVVKTATAPNGSPTTTEEQVLSFRMLSLVDAIFLHLTKMSRIELTRPFRTRELNGRKKPMSDSGAQRPTPKFTTLLLLSRNITLVYTGNAIRRKLSLSRNPNKSPKKSDFRGPRFFVPFSFWSIVRFDLFFFEIAIFDILRVIRRGRGASWFRYWRVCVHECATRWPDEPISRMTVGGKANRFS